VRLPSEESLGFETIEEAGQATSAEEHGFGKLVEPPPVVGGLDEGEAGNSGRRVGWAASCCSGRHAATMTANGCPLAVISYTNNSWQVEMQM
jgi:hypothetical protein